MLRIWILIDQLIFIGKPEVKELKSFCINRGSMIERSKKVRMSWIHGLLII